MISSLKVYIIETGSLAEKTANQVHYLPHHGVCSGLVRSVVFPITVLTFAFRVTVSRESS